MCTHFDTRMNDTVTLQQSIVIYMFCTRLLFNRAYLTERIGTMYKKLFSENLAFGIFQTINCVLEHLVMCGKTKFLRINFLQVYCLYGILSRMHGRNCNPFGNVATVTLQCVVQDVALVDHADIVYSICNIFHLYVYLSHVHLFYSHIAGADPGFDQGGPQIVTGLKLPFWGLSFVEFWCWGLIFGGQGGPPPGSAPASFQDNFCVYCCISVTFL